MRFSRKVLPLASLFLFVSVICGAQGTIPAAQIRPATTNNQVLTTTTANQPPSWQPPATAPVPSVQGTTPITVNGNSGTPETGPVVVACPTCGSISSGLTTTPVPPISGQYVVIYPTAASEIAGGDGPGCGGSDPTGEVVADTTSSTPHSVVAANTICGNGLSNNTWGASWTFTGALAAQAPQVVAANVTAVYAFSFNGFGPFYPGTSTVTVTATNGGSVALAASGQTYSVQQFTAQLSTATGSNLDSTTATAYVSYSTAPAGSTTLNLPSIGLMVFYTGTAPAASTAWNCAPPFYCNSATDTLGIDPNAIFRSDLLLPVTVATLGTPSPADQLAAVSDGASASDCTTGGGTTYVQCKSSGTAWAAYSPTGSAITQLTGGDCDTSTGGGAIPCTLASSGVTAGSYTSANISVDAKGRVTAASNGAGGGGIGVWHSGTGAPSQGTAATLTPVQGTTLSGGGCSKAFTSNVTGGNLISVTEVGETGMTTSLPPSDTLGTPFVLVGQNGFGGGTVNSALWVGNAPSSGADTVSWTCGGVTNPTLAMDETSGGSAVVDQTATQVLNTANPSTSLTPSLSGDLVIGFGGWLWSNGTGLAYTAGSGFTLGANLTGAANVNPTAEEFIYGGGTSSTAVAISQTGNTGTGAAWNGVALYAKHTGSVGNDGDFYVDSSTGFVYGPRASGLYLPFGPGVGMVKVDGTTTTINNGVISSTVGGVAVTGTPTTGDVPVATSPTTAAWGAAPGSGGALVFIGSQTVSSPAASITFSSISGSYTSLYLTFSGGTASSSPDNVYINFNGSTQSGFWNCPWWGVSGVNTDHDNGDAAGSRIGYLAQTAAGVSGSFNATIMYYTNASANQGITSQFSWNQYGTGPAGGSCFTGVDSLDVTSLTLTLGSGTDFLATTTATLYGVQ